MRWEYRVIRSPFGSLGQSALNEMGADGWEFVAVDRWGSYTFKRLAGDSRVASDTGELSRLPVEEVDKIANVTNRQIDFLHSSIQILIRKVEELEETVFGEEV